MKILQQKVLLLFISISALLVMNGTTCKDDTSDELEEFDQCGLQEVGEKKWEWLTIVPEDHFTYVEEGYAYYEFALESIENVCAYRHAKGSFYLRVSNLHGPAITFSAEVVYGIFYTQPITIWYSSTYDADNTLKEGKYEVGMKHLYGDLPGWFLPILTVKVIEQSSMDETHALMHLALRHIKITYNYYKWKDNS